MRSTIIVLVLLVATSPQLFSSLIVAHNPYTLTDALGRNVTIYSYPPSRVAALTPAIAESVCLMNCSKLVAVVQPVDWPPQLVNATKHKEVAVIGSFWMPNLEKLVLVKPDLIIADEGADLRMIGKLRELGLPVLFVKGGVCGSVKCVEHDILLIGKAIGEVDKAKEIVRWIDENLTRAEAQANEYKEVKVVILFYPFTWGIYAVGNGTFVNDLVTRLNAINLVRESGWPRVSKEKLLTLKPDVIIVLGGKELNPQRVVRDVEALGLTAKEVCVIYGTYADVVERPGPRISQAPWVLLKALHIYVSDSSGLYCSGRLQR